MRVSSRTSLWAALLPCIFLLGICAGDSLPTVEDVDALGARAARCVQRWEIEGAKVWLVFEYNEELLDPNEKSGLASLVKETGDGLAEVKAAQGRLKKQIEDYEGEDWEARYGKTGLWERLEGELYNVRLQKLSIDMRLAELSEEKEAMLRGALKETDAAIEGYDTLAARVIRVKVLGRLGEFDEGAREEGVKVAEGIIARNDAAETVKLEMEILKAKLEGRAETIGELARRVLTEKANNSELVMAAFSAVRQLADEQLLGLREWQWSGAGQLAGAYVLRHVERCVRAGEEAEIFGGEANMAALAARREPEEHRAALEYLAGQERFESAVVLRMAGAALMRLAPEKGVELLVKASRLQAQNDDGRSAIDAKMIAEEAARLACYECVKERGEVRQAIEAFDNYARLAEGMMKKELRGWYVELLEVGAEDVNDMELYGEWEYRARLVRGASSEWEFAEIIEECRERGYGEVRGDAAVAHCGLLLESEEDGAAEKVMNVCSENEDVTTIGMKAYKAAALARLGRVDEAARCMAEAKDWRYAVQAAEVLDKVAERVEELMERQDWVSLAADCNSIAGFCGRFIVEESRPAVAIEMILVCDANEKRGLARAEKLLAKTPAAETIDYIRCRARVLAAQGKYIEAAGLWTQIGNTLKGEATSEDGRTDRWWRAKYYELACLAKAETGEKAAITHSIEVLENSFEHIPALWAHKLATLKKKCVWH